MAKYSILPKIVEAWNFGPAEEGNITVGEIVHRVKKIWPKIDFEIQQNPNQPHEAGLLRLDCSKARNKLRWIPTWSDNETIEQTTLWYKTFYESGKVLSINHLNCYIEKAKSKKIA